MSQAPVVLFTYNRPEHTRRTVEALRANLGARETDLHIYSDGPKSDQHAESVRQVRSYLRTINGFKTVTVTERDRNMGLAVSIITGVTTALERHSSVIVVEDDMITAPNFLDFMNTALTVYDPRQDVFSVTGYNYPLCIPADYPHDAYLSYRSSSWGWGTWPDRWNKVDWAIRDFAKFLSSPRERALFARGGDDLLAILQLQMEGKLDSWSIRFDYAHYKHNALCLHPIRSKIQNIGFDGSGIHCGISEDYKTDLDPGGRPFTLRPDLQIDDRILQIFDKRFRPNSAFTEASTSIASKLSRIKAPAKRLLRSMGLGN